MTFWATKCSMMGEFLSAISIKDSSERHELSVIILMLHKNTRDDLSINRFDYGLGIDTRGYNFEWRKLSRIHQMLFHRGPRMPKLSLFQHFTAPNLTNNVPCGPPKDQFTENTRYQLRLGKMSFRNNFWNVF